MFDPEEENYEEEYSADNAEHMGFTSIVNLQQKALYLFGRFLARISGKNLPEEVPVETAKYLPLNEVENILREHGQDIGGGFVVGGDTPEEMQQSIHTLIAALVDRIMSNVLSEGVKNGFLDFEFNTDKNDFVFAVTERGKQLYADREDYDTGDSEESDHGV